MESDASQYIVVITTCVNEEEMARLTSALIERRLAACVQANEIKSSYRWQGKVETANEIRLMIKARSSSYAEIESLIKATLAYENPEVIAIALTAGSRMYFDWIDDETAK